MKDNLKKILAVGAEFIGGGIGYGLLEIIWRGYTHISMVITGGLCFVYLANLSNQKDNLFVLCTKGSLFITGTELLVGYTVNTLLHYNVWDYSELPLNFLGQICLPYSLLWFGLCALVVPLCRHGKKAAQPLPNKGYMAKQPRHSKP